MGGESSFKVRGTVQLRLRQPRNFRASGMSPAVRDPGSLASRIARQ
jgi:hypothetical protein